MKKSGPIPPLPRSMPPEKVVLLLAWVAFHQSRNRTSEPVEFAERTAQILLGVKSRTTIHKRFRPAQDDGWLKCEVPARVGRDGERNWGNRYVLGPKAARDRKRWVAFGHWLFGEQGCLRPFQSSGLLVHAAFGRDNRWLTFSLLMDRGNQWSTSSQVYEAAGGLLRSEGLVGVQLDRFVEWGAAERRRSDSDGVSQFRAVASHVDLLAIARERGWTDSYADLEVNIANDRLGLSHVTAQIRALRCCYCGGKGDDVSGRCELEHLPPKHWTGTSQAGLLLPVCNGCNNAHSHQIKQTRRGLIGRREPQLRIVTAEEWAILSNHSDKEILKANLLGFGFHARRYRDAISTGRLRDAESAADALAPIAQAVREGTLTLIDVEGGEARHVEMDPEFPVWLAREVVDVVPRAPMAVPKRH